MRASPEPSASAANESHNQAQQSSECMDSELPEDKENSSTDRNAEPTATHNSPRTWLLTSALSPLAVRLIRHLLAHGDCVVACLPPHEIDDEDRGAEFSELIDEVKSQRADRAGWRERIRGIRCDGRVAGTCGAAIAEAVSVFGRIDILLCCKSEAVVGTVEELSTTPITQNLMRHQFETIFFSQVNFIKATLPLFRTQHTGHIIILTSTGGHIGTPGMSAYAASVWALEGYCDSLAYEIAPFNIKVTIVQPNQEIQSLTNHLIFAPPISAYAHDFNPAPNLRDMLSNVLNTHPDTVMPSMPESVGSPASVDSSSLEPELGQGEIIHRYPKLPPGAADRLVMETVHALTAIGGHENPPSRHIVGYEGSTAVKEKLKTVTEELEDFVDASLAVDIFERTQRPVAAQEEMELD
ncbi:short chain dehydrogenase domain-containing protein [Sarocladium implicatum]|nr:short chain dehydrogenase domain-containing protein [Sarocladium implicatum]